MSITNNSFRLVDDPAAFVNPTGSPTLVGIGNASFTAAQIKEWFNAAAVASIQQVADPSSQQIRGMASSRSSSSLAAVGVPDTNTTVFVAADNAAAKELVTAAGSGSSTRSRSRDGTVKATAAQTASIEAITCRRSQSVGAGFAGGSSFFSNRNLYSAINEVMSPYVNTKLGGVDKPSSSSKSVAADDTINKNAPPSASPASPSTAAIATSFIIAEGISGPAVVSMTSIASQSVFGAEGLRNRREGGESGNSNNNQAVGCITGTSTKSQSVIVGGSLTTNPNAVMASRSSLSRYVVEGIGSRSQNPGGVDIPSAVADAFSPVGVVGSFRVSRANNTSHAISNNPPIMDVEMSQVDRVEELYDEDHHPKAKLLDGETQLTTTTRNPFVAAMATAIKETGSTSVSSLKQVPPDLLKLSFALYAADQRQQRMDWAAKLPWYDPRRHFYALFPDGLLPQGSIGGSAFSLATNTLGAGTIALPSAFQATGGLLGAIILLICLVTAVYAIWLQVVVQEMTGFKGYQQLSKHLIGLWAEKLMGWIILVLCWGVMIVYVVAIGNLLEPFLEVDGAPELFRGDWGRRMVTTVYWAALMLPLCLPTKINSLRHASLAGLAATGLLTIVLMAYAANTSEVISDGKRSVPSASNIPVAELNVGAIMAFPVFIFGTACHANTYSVYSELTNRSPQRMIIVGVVTMTFVGVIYLACGLSGVAIFGEDTKDNILSNFDEPLEVWYVAAAFFGVAITLTTAFPLCVFPARDALLQMLGYPSAEACPTYVRVPVAGGLAVTALTAGLVVPGITMMFGLLGGLLCSNIVYIWPAIFALRSGKWGAESIGRGNVIATWALLTFGIVAAIFGTVLSVVDIAGG